MMRILETLIEAICERAKQEPLLTPAQAKAISDAYEQECRRALMHRPWWWRLIGRSHIARRTP